MRCPRCATPASEGQKFCAECGAPLALACPSCGTAASDGQKFCAECGAPLRAGADAAAASPVVAQRSAPPAPVAERRVVSVLFADLVGFTPLTEARDAEDVRELLSRYFALARTTVTRYGGLVEKFIGDAVMAVWGTPTVHEDDAERAVRAALDLVAAVAVLGEEVDAPGLQLRAGVVTGEVAVTLGATGEGMVAGDAVNTAARVQSAAEPGCVYVDTATRRATSAALSYADAGEHLLKGKSEPVALFRADRVVAGARGQQRVDGLEAPFTGRDRDLRVVKELFHTSVDERRCRLVSVTGVPGIGKSRLAWEFFKYVDGVAGLALWHVGRCLSYGDGVAYWSLAEVVRMRLRIAEADPADVVVERLTAGLEEYVADAEDRAWLAPRLAALLGVADVVAPGASFSRDELFAAWRLFFERLAERAPVIIVLEDLQWADSGLLDFVEYLLDWSAQTPLFLLTLARPELADRRPDWATGRPNVTTLHLDPLSHPAMSRLIGGLVDGLPEAMRTAMVGRAEGVPLYAVETVRMLIDRDVIVPREGRYVVADPARPLGDLDVPPSLHAVVAARLDGLTDEERRVLSDAAVLGLSFTRDGLLALRPEGQTDPVLAALVRKQVLAVTADPRSPERGQYRFLQAVVRTVAYETLSRRDRKSRHLATARFLEQRADAVDLAAIVASHYLDAADAVPGDEDAAELRRTGRVALVRAADRAAALGAVDEALRHYERALTLSEDDHDLRVRLSERAGRVALLAADADRALEHLALARAAHEAAGDLTGVLRIAGQQGDALFVADRVSQAPDLLEPPFAAAADGPPSAELAAVAAATARAYFFLDRFDEAAAWADRACAIAEKVPAWGSLVLGLNYRALALWTQGRPVEALGLLRLAVELLERHEPVDATMSPYNNLSLLLQFRDPDEAFDVAQRGRDWCARRGDRPGLVYLTTQLMAVHNNAGRWDETERLYAEMSGTHLKRSRLSAVGVLPVFRLLVDRGDVDGARRIYEEMWADHPPTDPEMRANQAAMSAMIANGDGRHADAVREGGRALTGRSLLDDFTAFGWIAGCDSALRSGSAGDARRLVDVVARRPAGTVAPYVAAQRLRFQARLDALLGESDIGAGFSAAAHLLAELGMTFERARVQLEHAEWLAECGDVPAAVGLVGLARPVFERLRAPQMLQRADALVGDPAAARA